LRPEPRKPSPAAVAEEFYGKTNLAADPAARRSPDEVAIEDISREPAPYVVEPMPSWGAFSESFHASDMLDRPITEADIARDWVVQSIEPTEVSGKDGVVLPFSFKVLKSRDAAPAESAPDAPAQLDASPAPVAEASQVGIAAAVEEIREAGVTAPEEALAPPELPSLTIAAELESASVAGPESTASVAEEAPIAAEPASEPEQQPVESAVSEPQTEEISPVPEAAAPETVSDEAAAAETAHQPESVFAREGFWNGSAPGEVAASAEARLNGDVKPPYPAAAQGENIDESSKPPEEWVSAWKALLRIGSVLPWMAKTLPAGETGLSADAGAPAEVRQDVAGLRLVQYEIRTTVQDHTLQLKRMDEQLGRIRESLESKSSDSDLVENVESMSRLVRIVGAGLGGLVLVLILLVAILLAHGR